MKIKVPTEFQVFNDGRCLLYAVRGNQLAECLGSLPFGKKGIGYKRMYAAAAASQKLSLLVCVPHKDWVAKGQRAVIRKDLYSIEQVQPLPDSCPPSMLLSLNRLGATP
ncbi:MAG: hypothetical protein RSC76_07115 [Oscillospiraceae bacterium]